MRRVAAGRMLVRSNNQGGAMSTITTERPNAALWFGALAAATGGTFRAELLDLYPNDTQVVAVNRATGTRGDATLSADAALVFEVSDGVVTAITAHEARSSNIRDPRQATPLLDDETAGTDADAEGALSEHRSPRNRGGFVRSPSC
jgi:hypothetical protein